MSHIPPGDDCIHAWGNRIRGLMERYQHVVRFGIFGHTHDESFNVIKSFEGEKNIGLNFIAGSLTPYTNKNPSFTVIEVDEEFMIPVNFETYYFNLTKANSGEQTTWEIFHDFKEHYEIETVSPDNLNNLALKILKDEKVAI